MRETSRQLILLGEERAESTRIDALARGGPARERDRLSPCPSPGQFVHDLIRAIRKRENTYAESQRRFAASPITVTEGLFSEWVCPSPKDEE